MIMPSVQTVKKRMCLDVFYALALAQVEAREGLIACIDPGFFAYCLIKANRERFVTQFGGINLDAFIEAILEGSPRIEKPLPISSDIPVHPFVSECILFSKRDPEKFHAPQIFYKLVKHDEFTGAMAAKHNIVLSGILSMVGKETRKKDSERKPGLAPRVAANSKRNSEGLVDRYCINLTKKAAEGGLPPVFCRESEMQQVLIALMKKNKANPLLIGEPGVGKTAIVEGLAQRFVDKNVPERLSRCRLVTLSMAAALHGTSLRGQFEERLDGIMKEIVEDKNTIVFIDEIHTLVGAGSGSESALDAGNIMKPYLARGDFRCIGATTFEDYHKYLKKDKALLRRFQRIFISEPEESDSKKIIQGLAASLEAHHGCTIKPEVFDAVIALSRRFLTDRFFPDKAIDCLDHACAKSSLSSSIVTTEIIEEVISTFSDVPLSMVRKGEMERLDSARADLLNEVVGNDAAIESFCNRVMYCCSTKDSRVGPMAALTLYGPKGVGKKTAISRFSNSLCGKDSMIVINGAEFTEQHSVSRIIGSPPGYVGYNDETYILREIRRRPHAVLMIKNVQLMHTAVLEQIRQIVETGKITDVHGMKTDFSNCILVFVVDIDKSSNKSMGFGRDSKTDYGPAFEKIRQSIPLLQSVKYQVGFVDLDQSFVSDLVNLEMNTFQDELERGGIIVTYDDECSRFFCGGEGVTPSDIRSAVREKLEMAFCQASTSGAGEYRVGVEDGELTVHMLQELTVTA